MKTRTLNDWCRIFGVEIIDNDGFPGEAWGSDCLYDIETFVHGLAECTIIPVDKGRYAVLEDLWK